MITSYILVPLYAISRWRCNMRRKDREITDSIEIIKSENACDFKITLQIYK